MMTEFQSPTEQSVEIAFVYSFVSTFILIYKLYDIGLLLFSITNLQKSPWGIIATRDYLRLRVGPVNILIIVMW